jgi:hypothetical protein
LSILLPVLVAAAAGALATWARIQWAQFKAKQPDFADILARYARIAVEAAQQAFDDNAQRKEYAVKIIYQWLEQAGIKGVLVALVEAEIERQVGLKKSDAAFWARK